jgi:hypothetical protein
MALARVCWVPEAEGGRKVPFTGSRYSTVARFEDDKSWPDEAWSLVLNFNEPTNGSHCVMADVHFLVAEAPVHWLTQGSKFELYEGRNCVARGEILSDQCSRVKA